ncbi:alpha/beta fold hydrolase [Amnibacterium flavum]|uniref:Alpha/beta hydrolase n=1 Tax=Amnibacterium flavum TaxID=2173173 RepID=A0A2V1HR84_9MICO|nr:alpha/beta fold hydrolase [Amnibacterium flavum]PVZ95075.1 alpha/beta hydrolase [Amnibacterium flavum]
MSVDLLWTGPADGPVLVLAHGAGAPMDSPWMETVTGLLAERGIRVARFEFGYMAARRGGARKPPPKAEKLIDEYREAVAELVSRSHAPVVIGGKSMGGRVASMVADELAAEGTVSGLVCLGYPFHPPGAPEKLRVAHLEGLTTPALIVQGTRDPLGTAEEVARYPLSGAVRVVWLEDGEHDFRPRVKLTGLTSAQHLSSAADSTADFVRDLG